MALVWRHGNLTGVILLDSLRGLSKSVKMVSVASLQQKPLNGGDFDHGKE